MQITVEEVKNYLKVENDEDDNLISSLIIAAMQYCEVFLGRPITEGKMTDENRWEVPEPVRIAIYMLVAHWYENRGVMADKLSGEIAYSVSALLWPYRLITF